MDRKVNLRVLDGSKSVALRKERVDRKMGVTVLGIQHKGRSPQGERG